jgi:glycoprotein 3-alpha-L-fucosyltransferase
LNLVRLEFADGLADHFPINFHGGCAKSIKSNHKKLVTQNCSRNSECELDYLTNYKFYLAFENSNCSYYNTEKFWRSLEHFIIPVVIQPSKEFYTRIAPPNSFIHAEDFDFDYKRLSDFLKKVSSDFQLYKQYLEWTKKYKPLYVGKSVEQMRMCEMCYKLNTETASIYYESYNDFMNDGCS